MDELDLLKKDWKEKEKDLPKLSFDEIYNMIWKKSSSIVKWIFYISLGELLLGIILNLLLSKNEYWEQTQMVNLTQLNIIVDIISILIIGYFTYRFYMNYKNISVTDDAKTLMENIIKTRKTVKNYIKVSLLFGAIVIIFSIIFTLLNDPMAIEMIHENTDGSPSFIFWAILILGTIIFTAIALVLIWLFYQLLYGILLKRLQVNYKELKKLDD